MDALAARYNLRIARYLKSGAVFLVNAGQLEALRQDETQDHLSGDVRLQSSVDPMTAESIGADQVWAGLGQPAGAVGRRASSVAVIDSGIDTRHAALRRRVLATMDFTGGDGMDRFGHGTHVAGDHRRAARADGGHARPARHRAGRVSHQPARARRRRVGDGERRDRGDRLGDRAPPRIQHPGHQPVARRAGAAAVPRRSAVRGGGAGGARRPRRRGGGGELRPDGGRPGRVRRDHVAGQQPVRDHGGRARHARHGEAVRRHAGGVQLEGADAVRPDASSRTSSRRARRIVSAESADSYLSQTYPARHVAGSGVNAYMQLSGTSMAAGVVSGAAALLFEAKPSLTTRADEGGPAADAARSCRRPAWSGAGAGMVNAAAAVELVETNQVPETTIGGEDVVASGIHTVSTTVRRVAALNRRFRTTASRSRSSAATATDPLGHGCGRLDRLGHRRRRLDRLGHRCGRLDRLGHQRGRLDCLGHRRGRLDCLGHRRGRLDCLGHRHAGDSIVWGTGAGDSIVWGTDAGDSIVWGTAAGDSIVWGTDAGDSIVWGTADFPK